MEYSGYNGLTHLEAQKRLQSSGFNRIQTHEVASISSLIATQFFTVINVILSIAALFSFLIKNTIDGIFIVSIVIINALFGFLQEYRAQKSLEQLKQYTTPLTRVIRDQQQKEIPAEEIVPGDIVVLSEGSRIPADGKLLQATHLEIDEAILSGESIAVIKNSDDRIFLGTLVIKGKGLLEVANTGKNTQFGQIAQTLATIQIETPPLQKTLSYLGKILSISALLLGLLIIPIGFVQGQQLIPLILVAISIGVAAIPEGLPAVVTMAFAIGMHRMANQGAIVRKMIAIETLGSIQIILVDKTGTITKNEMTVKDYFVRNNRSFHSLLDACILGNTAYLAPEEKNRFEIIGDPTDGALLLWAREHKDSHEIQDTKHVLDEYVFDTETKTITTVWGKDDQKFVFVRGAPEAILSKSKLTRKEKKELETKIDLFAKKRLRVIAFAYKQEKQTGKLTRSQLEQELTFLGFVGLYDPPRKEVKEAIKKCRAAGIQVIMVTGDNEVTAMALAKEIGLIEKNEDVITGEMLQNLSDEELGKLILKTTVFARTKPEEKLRLVTVIQKQHMVVGVTGDGVNDALALKKADVGVAMGEEGTDVAKEAADIVLTDDNFATLVKAIEEGRMIYRNISNATLYLLSGNLAEITFVLLAVLLQLPFPLLPTQILWMNLVTDSLPALAIATGRKDGTLLDKRFRNSHDQFLSPSRIFIILLIGISLALFMICLFTLLLSFFPETLTRTIVFNVFIVLQLMVALYFGRDSLKKGNKFLLATIVGTVVLQLIITLTPAFENIMHLGF